MSEIFKSARHDVASPATAAYDPNNLDPIDEEARKFDDTSDGIDWDEIIATTQDDFLAGRYSFNSADYPTHEEAMEAMDRFLEDLWEEALREVNSLPARSLDATR